MRRQPFTRAALLVAVSLAASAGPAAAQNRPQLSIVRAEADLAAETLLIQGEYFVWAKKKAPVVTLAGSPLAILGLTEVEILAQLPPDLAPGAYLRGPRGSPARPGWMGCKAPRA